MYPWAVDKPLNLGAYGPARSHSNPVVHRATSPSRVAHVALEEVSRPKLDRSNPPGPPLLVRLASQSSDGTNHRAFRRSTVNPSVCDPEMTMKRRISGFGKA
ncbi:hypothetical protein NL676_015221 [Syzygium grande]|nr:hypothetical protein NL676_015221 [Syzygium grande]